MKRIAAFFALIATLGLSPAPADAYVGTENTDAYVVSSCGAQAFTLGNYATITQLANGNLCDTGASAVTATIGGPLGPAVGPTAAVAITPQDGASGSGSVASANAPNTNVWGASGATPGPNVSTIGYSELTFQNTAVGTGGAASLQGSWDGGTTWTTVETQRLDTGVCSISPGLATAYLVGNLPPLVRLNLTALGSGTFSSSYALRSTSGFPSGGFVCQGSGAAANAWTNTPISTDPCASSATLKSSVAINVTSAVTTQLVALTAAQIVYVCGFALSIAPSATSADTAQFEYGTSTTCTSPTVLTGTFGNGDLTSAAPPTVVNYGGGGQTVMASIASNAICIVTTGTAVSVQGVLTYVKQ